MLKDVRFRFQHEGCWLQETTERFPGLMLVVSSAYVAGDDVVVTVTAHAQDAKTIDNAEAQWSRDDRIRNVRRLHDGPRGARFHVTYSSPHSIFHHILEHTPVSIGTIRVAEGSEHYQIMGESQAIQDMLMLLSGKGSLQVESVREPDAEGKGQEVAEPRPWDALTDKQIEALVLAQLGGYYQWPRDRSASALAEELGLSSSAFLDHLRHAEGKLLSAIVEQMRRDEPGRIETIRARRRGAAARSSA